MGITCPCSSSRTSYISISCLSWFTRSFSANFITTLFPSKSPRYTEPLMVVWMARRLQGSVLLLGRALVRGRLWDGEPDVVKTAVKGNLRMRATMLCPKLRPALRFFANGSSIRCHCYNVKRKVTIKVKDSYLFFLVRVRASKTTPTTFAGLDCLSTARPVVSHARTFCI